MGLISTPSLSFEALDAKVGKFPIIEALRLNIDCREFACPLPKVDSAAR